RQTERVAFNGERDIPFAGRGTLHGTGFHLALDRAMVDHLDAPDFREGHAVIMRDAEPTLREGEGVVSVLSLETREAGFFGMLFDTTEERLKGQIDAHGNILQDLGMHRIEGRSFVFENGKRILLLKTGERDTVSLIGGFTHFQQVVIEPPTLFKGLVELLLL